MIKAIVAIGNQGQVGLNGQLPWHDKDDLKWFREQTMGKVCVVGHRTYFSLPTLHGRRVVVDSIDRHPENIALNINFGARYIIIGGPKTYARWNHLVDEWLVSRIDYSGPADAWFDFSMLDGKTVTYRNGGTVHDHGRNAIREQAPASATGGSNETT